MICISVTPESRKFAKVDMLNASGQCDLIELGLDRFLKVPDIKELIGPIEKPVLVSCRRKEDGGHFIGSEEERQALLRQAIIAEPDYVELEVDIARTVPRFGKTKRVVSYTSLDKPLGNVDDVFERAAQANADVVKFTWPTPTLEAAWPLLAAVSQKRDLPVVGLGLGLAGLTFSLLGRKYGAPWIYGALEKGMEAYNGQATVHELDEIYGWRDLDSKTRLVGIVGFGPAEETTIRVLNRAFQDQGLNARCLPLAIDNFDKMAKRLDTLKINALLTSRNLASFILPLAEHVEEAVSVTQFADLLLKQADGWHAYNSLWRSAVRTLEERLGKSAADERPLERHNVLVLGTGGLARTMIYGIRRRKGLISISAADEKEGQELARLTEARFITTSALYDTLADVVVLADPKIVLGHHRDELNPSYLRESMAAVDVAHFPEASDFIREAAQRGCKTVEPTELFANLVAAQFKSFTGRELEAGFVREVLGE